MQAPGQGCTVHDADNHLINNNYLSNSGQTLNINSSETIVNTMQNINRINDVPTFVPFGSLNASPPISGMWNPSGNTSAAKQNNITKEEKYSLFNKIWLLQTTGQSK